MKRTNAFIKRNLTEMVRDPIIYIFCLIFPILMILIFQLIDNSIGMEGNTLFNASSLMPGMMMFASSFVMLLMTLLISKDRSTAFLKRLYISPLKTSDYMAGYIVPGLLIGVAQHILCLLFCALFCLIFDKAFFSFGKCLLLIICMLPVLLINIFLGIIFGSVLNDKAAPGLSSAVISGAGLLGGAWMPLETMKGFSTVCLCLPFYPSVYLGRIITHAPMQVNSEASQTFYSFDTNAIIGLCVIFVYLIGLGTLAFFIVKRSQKEK